MESSVSELFWPSLRSDNLASMTDAGQRYTRGDDADRPNDEASLSTSDVPDALQDDLNGIPPRFGEYVRSAVDADAR
jgi:hypothetical protein